VREVQQILSRTFVCECGYKGDRAVTFSEETRFRIENGQLFHYSVGVAVFCRFDGDEEDRLVLLRRATHPVGAFTIPSGHWDVGEAPRASAEKEVKEETGLKPESLAWPEKPENGILEEGCRSGSDLHIWHFYHCLAKKEDADLKLPADKSGSTHRTGEADMIGWIPVSQVKAGLFWLTRPAGHFLGKALDSRLLHVLPR
jgi:ADP-ribose pyrophosphatase YjhB (NUDIX family)